MKLVIDTNRIMAALIKDSVSRRLLANNRFEFITPTFSRTEIQKYQKMILDKSGLTEQEFGKLFDGLFSNIRLFDETQVRQRHYAKAAKILEKIDPDDAPFLALALQEKCGIWSDDKHFQQPNTTYAKHSKTKKTCQKCLNI